MKQKRFKTADEFIGHYGKDRKIIVYYDGASEAEMIQKKAFALGYRWADSQQRVQTCLLDSGTIFMSDEGVMTYGSKGDGDDKANDRDYVRLTYEQFKRGDMPSYAKSYEKCDAYIETDTDRGRKYIGGFHAPGIIYYSATYREFRDENIDFAYAYNLMSYEDFSDAYSPAELPRLFGHGVTVGSGEINVGCQTVSYDEAKAFYDICNKIENDQGIHKITEVYDYICQYYNELFTK